MSTASRCRHIRLSGAQCGSPALRGKNFCFYHQNDRPVRVKAVPEEYFPQGEIDLPYFEDAHSIQAVIRQVMHMLMERRLERRTASTLLYALQIASSNLKRMEQEKPEPEQVVTEVETNPDAKREESIALPSEMPASETIAGSAPAAPIDSAKIEVSRPQFPGADHVGEEFSEEAMPPGTIQACAAQPLSPVFHQRCS